MKKKEKKSQKNYLNGPLKTFTNIKLYNKEDVIQQVDVWIGKKAVTDLFSNKDILFTIRKADKNKFNAKIIFNNPIIAPINTTSIYGEIGYR